MSFMVAIKTQQDPRFTATVPIFKTRIEADRYAEHLVASQDFITGTKVIIRNARPSAAWPKGARTIRWLSQQERWADSSEPSLSDASRRKNGAVK